MDVGYIRVSSYSQNTARQLDGLILEKIFEDKQSGRNMDRPQLAACLDFVREGDTLHVHSLDRLARSLPDLLKILSKLLAKKVEVLFHKENLRFSGHREAALDTLLLHILGAVAQFERAQIRERQREGIAKAKEQGRHLGRPVSLNADEIFTLRQERQNGATAQELARRYGVGRSTIYRILNTGG